MKRVKSLLLLLFIGALLVLPTKAKALTLIESAEVEGIGGLRIAGASTSVTKNLTLATPFDTTTITAVPAGDGVTIEGAGQVTIKEGANQFVVTATKGAQKETLIINLNVVRDVSAFTTSAVDPKTGEPINNPQTGAFLNYSLIISGIAVSLIVINKVRRKTKFYRI